MKHFISDKLRATMRKVPLPVVVVTGSSDGISRGITCSSFNSISLTPPVVSFAVKVPSSTKNILEKSNLFAVHLLSSVQIAQATNFSSPKTQQDFTNFLHYLKGKERLPIIEGCVSVLICNLHSTHRIGDHEVWYSNVVEILPFGIKKHADHRSYEEMKPLLYYDGTFRNIGDEVFIESFENKSLAIAEWTHRAHLRMAWIYLRDSSDLDPFAKIK